MFLSDIPRLLGAAGSSKDIKAAEASAKGNIWKNHAKQNARKDFVLAQAVALKIKKDRLENQMADALIGIRNLCIVFEPHHKHGRTRQSC